MATWDDVAEMDQQAKSPASDPWASAAEFDAGTPQAAMLGSVVQRMRAAESDPASEFGGVIRTKQRAMYAVERYPFIGGMLKATHDAAVVNAANKIRGGTAGPGDYAAVGDYIIAQEKAGNRSFGGQVFDVLTQIPGFAAEFALTAGAYGGAKAGTQAGIKKALGQAVESSVGKAVQATVPRAVGVAAQAAANPQLVARTTAQRMIPDLQQTVDEQGNVVSVDVGEDKEFLTALGQGFVDAGIELGTERAGGHLARGAGKLAGFVPGSQKVQALKAAVSQKWLAAKPGRTFTMLDDALKAGGWNGVVGEMMEERAGDVARLVTGLEGLEENVTGQIATGRFSEAGRQLGVEATAFSVPGAVNMGAKRLAQLKTIRAKGYVSAEDGQAAGIEGATRKERLANADAEIQQLQQEVQDAEAIPGPEAEVRPEQGREDVRWEGQVEVPAEPAGEGAPEVLKSRELLDWLAAAEAAAPEVAAQGVPAQGVELTPPVQAPQPGEMTPEQVQRVIEQGVPAPKPRQPEQLPPMEIGPEGTVAEQPKRDVSAEIREALASGPVTVTTPQVPGGFKIAKVREDGKVVSTKGRIITPDETWTVQKPAAQQAATTPPEAQIPLQATEPAQTPGTPLEATGKATDGIPPAFGKYPSQGVGIAATVPLATPGIGRSAKHFFQRFFTSRGELPQEAYDSKVAKEGRVAKEMNELRNRATDFRRGIRSALGGKELSQADVENMNAVLRGDADPMTVPSEVRAPIEAMRDHIDSLSRRLISEGVAQGDLVGIIEQNMGVYTTRSYRVFDDPKWRDQVPAGVRNRAVAAIREMYPDKSDAEVAGILESLLFRGAADTPSKLLKGSKLGSKDLTSFMLRKEVPEWLRDLWGEYKDAGVNYARSVFKMSHLLANQRFLNEVRGAGLGKWLRTNEDGPIVNEYGRVVAKLAADSSSVMEPLNGLYTTPEIKKAFERLDSAGDMPDWLRVMMTINYAVKYGKTVGSAMTHVRNTVSNVGFAVANGHWRLDKAGKAIWATATGTFQLSNPEFRKYYNHLAELGIVGEDVRAGELKDALRDASQADIDEFLYNRELRQANKLVKAGRAGVRFLNSLYQAEDAVWKIYAFENEKARYAEAYPAWSAEKVERHAAEIVRNTYPTYSKIPEGIKALRRFPLVGTFVSFPSEVVRTTFHTLKLGISELQAQETRSIGAQRLAGTAVAMGGLSILSRAMMAMFGIGDDEDDDLRWFVPPWQENSRFIYTAQPENATYKFIDLGYSDPHAYLTDSAVAFMRGDDWIDSLGKSLTEFLQPFTSEEILAGALMDVRSNEDNKVYNPKDEAGEQAKDVVEHLWTKALEPGTITSLRRIQTAAAGTDPEKEITTEVLAVTTGQRLQKIDVEKSLGFRVREFGKALTEIQSIARKTATSRGTATGEMVATDVARMEKLRLAEFAEMQQIIGAARRLGVPEKHIRTLLKSELADDVAKQLLTGDYSPYKMTPQTIKQMRQAKPEEFKQRLDAWRGELKRMRDQP